MTRFNITLEEGVKFVIKCFNEMNGGELFVPKIPSFKITDLVKALGPNLKTKIVGIRPGEKIHEEMITTSDALNTFEYKDYFVILSNAISHYNYQNNNFDKKKFSKSKLKGKKIKKLFSYNSETNNKFMTVGELKKLISDIEKDNG